MCISSPKQLKNTCSFQLTGVEKMINKTEKSKKGVTPGRKLKKSKRIRCGKERTVQNIWYGLKKSIL